MGLSILIRESQRPLVGYDDKRIMSDYPATVVGDDVSTPQGHNLERACPSSAYEQSFLPVMGYLDRIHRLGLSSYGLDHDTRLQPSQPKPSDSTG
jgi:hypothetical protein